MKQEQRGPCVKCGAYKGTFYHKHHIIYEEEEKTAILCVSCHKRITSINTSIARRLGYRKLTPTERIYIFKYFLNDAVKRRKFTKHDYQLCMEYVKCAMDGVEVG